MLIPVLGGPEESGVIWVDEREMEARRFRRQPDPTGGPARSEQRGNRLRAQFALAARLMAAALRHR
jgi:hypothetical protein